MFKRGEKKMRPLFTAGLFSAAIAVSVCLSPMHAFASETQTHAIENLSVAPISVNCLKVTWDGEENRDYTVTCKELTPIGYGNNMYFQFVRDEDEETDSFYVHACYITGLREGEAYEITVTPEAKEGEYGEYRSSWAYSATETVEVVEEYPHEDGWTNCFTYECADKLTMMPSAGAIAGAIEDPITHTGIMRDEYGDYCVAMGTFYGYCGDRFLITLENGTQFTVKICDSKGNRWYHKFGYRGEGKSVVEFIHAKDALPACAAYTGNYGAFHWYGLNFDNIACIQKINDSSEVSY